MAAVTRDNALAQVRRTIGAYHDRMRDVRCDTDYLPPEGAQIVNEYCSFDNDQQDLVLKSLGNPSFLDEMDDRLLLEYCATCMELDELLGLDSWRIGRVDSIIGVADLSRSDKIKKAIEYSDVLNEILEEIGDVNILVAQMAVVSVVLIGLAATGYGAVAEALGFVLLAVGAAFSGTDLLAGIIELGKFFMAVEDAKSEEDLKVCGKLFGDAVAKIGVDGLFFALSMFGLKKSSTRLTTRTVADNSLNARKWKGKRIEEKIINIDEPSKTNSKKFLSWEDMKSYYEIQPIKFTEFLRNNKPKYSPDVKQWFAKGGSLEIKEINGNKIWIYTNSNGDSVPYINGYVKFPEKYLHPDIREANIGSFSGNRFIDNEKLLEILKSDYGIVEMPDGYIPHHDVNNGVFQFVEESIHKEFTHIGGNSLYGGK